MNEKFGSLNNFVVICFLMLLFVLRVVHFFLGARTSTSGVTECFENDGDQEMGVIPGGVIQPYFNKDISLLY